MKTSTARIAPYVPSGRPALRQPVVQERREPGAAGLIVHGAVGEVGVAGLGAGQRHALVAAGGPAADDVVGDVGMELQRIGGIAVAERLHRKGVALGDQLGAAWQLEALAVP